MHVLEFRSENQFDVSEDVFGDSEEDVLNRNVMVSYFAECS